MLPSAGLDMSKWPASTPATAHGVSCRKSLLRLKARLVIDVICRLGNRRLSRLS